MSWIETVPYEEASEVLKKIYDENKAKFGRVINLVKVQSLRPETLAQGRDLYRHLMSQPGGLRRRERVLIATVVSQLNGCHYWVESHEQDLREEIGDDEEVLKIQEDYKQADLDPKIRVLLDFAAKVTFAPKELRRTDVETLRAQGFSDVEILDAVQLIGYFNYSNRVMDSLGIEPEPEMRYRKKNT